MENPKLLNYRPGFQYKPTRKLMAMVEKNTKYQQIAAKKSYLTKHVKENKNEDIKKSIYYDISNPTEEQQNDVHTSRVEAQKVRELDLWAIRKEKEIRKLKGPAKNKSQINKQDQINKFQESQN